MRMVFSDGGNHLLIKVLFNELRETANRNNQRASHLVYGILQNGIEQTNHAIFDQLADIVKDRSVALSSCPMFEELLPALVLSEANEGLVELVRYSVVDGLSDLHIQEPKNG